jgi:hypothetical protein
MTQVEEDDNEDDSLHIKRVGCEYINAQNETIFELTKSNGDESLLLLHNMDTPPSTTKVKETVDSTATLGRYTDGVQRSFKNRNDENLADLTEEQKASGRLYSLLYSYTNVRLLIQWHAGIS